MGDEAAAATTISKRSLAIAGHRTSISLEEAFWQGLREIARRRQTSVAALVAEIDAGRGAANLSSAVRVFVLASASLRQAESPANGPDAPDA
jgi:predicted DNA-binding ribbon-helix-helix protein